LKNAEVEDQRERSEPVRPEEKWRCQVEKGSHEEECLEALQEEEEKNEEYGEREVEVEEAQSGREARLGEEGKVRERQKDKEETYPDCRIWPEEVKCGMNIKAWKEELKKWGLETEHGYVVEGFKNGFSQGIPEHRVEGERFYSPRNHATSEGHLKEIRSKLIKELKAGRMFGPFTEEEVWERVGFFRTSPMGMVVNGDGSTRVINDLSYPRRDRKVVSVNSLVDKSEFETSWDDFKKVARFFSQTKEEVELGIFDWEKAYRQIPTRMDQWRYLMI
jgi:hypothetical protein